MSLYNALNGYDPACILFLPMLGRKQEEYPRFRDCFLSDDKKHIAIYTRCGGGNRNCGMGEEELMADPLFYTSYDDDFDETYATYEFNVPEKWQSDFDKIVDGKLNEVFSGVRGFEQRILSSTCGRRNYKQTLWEESIMEDYNKAIDDVLKLTEIIISDDGEICPCVLASKIMKLRKEQKDG